MILEIANRDYVAHGNSLKERHEKYSRRKKKKDRKKQIRKTTHSKQSNKQ